jgi:regulator of PEP synthase PpsR (kinase-PPPase family)
LPEVREYLIDQARQNNIPVVDIMGPMMETLSDITDLNHALNLDWYIRQMKIILKRWRP